MDSKDELVTRLENTPGMDWPLRAWILHNHGYTNRGGEWHPGPGAPTWTPKPDKKPSSGHRGRRHRTRKKP